MVLDGLALLCDHRFLEHSLPVKAFYQQRGLCAVIPATEGVDEVFKYTTEALSHFLPKKSAIKVCRA